MYTVKTKHAHTRTHFQTELMSCLIDTLFNYHAHAHAHTHTLQQRTHLKNAHLTILLVLTFRLLSRAAQLAA